MPLLTCQAALQTAVVGAPTRMAFQIPKRHKRPLQASVGEGVLHPNVQAISPDPGRGPTPSQGSRVAGGRNSRWRVATLSVPIPSTVLVGKQTGTKRKKEHAQRGFQLRPISHRPSLAGAAAENVLSAGPWAGRSCSCRRDQMILGTLPSRLAGHCSPTCLTVTPRTWSIRSDKPPAFLLGGVLP